MASAASASGFPQTTTTVEVSLKDDESAAAKTSSTARKMMPGWLFAVGVGGGSMGLIACLLSASFTANPLFWIGVLGFGLTILGFVLAYLCLQSGLAGSSA